MVIKNEIKKPDIIKLLIFDIDGTLVEYRTLEELVKKAFKSCGIVYNEELFKMQGKTVADLLTKNEYELCFSLENLALLWESHYPLFKEYEISSREFWELMIFLEVEFTHAMHDVPKVLHKLSANYPMTLATNWFESAQRRKLDKFDLNKYFDKMYTPETLFSKPRKEHFFKILEYYNVLPEEALVIGDSSTDIKASLYGINTVLIDYYDKAQRLYDLGTAVITEFKDLERVLKL